jgi:hypothetical protein
MDHSQTHLPKLSATDIAQYSDIELDQYLEANGKLEYPESFLCSVLMILLRCVQVEDPETCLVTSFRD